MFKSSMYCVLCVNSLWCSPNMCNLSWLVSLNKTLLNRMWGYIRGGVGSLATNFITPYRIMPVRCQPFWNHLFSTSQAVAMILLEQSWFAIAPRCPAWVGTRAGFTCENSGGGGGWTCPNLLPPTTAILSLAVWSESKSKIQNITLPPQNIPNVFAKYLYIAIIYTKKN